MLIDRDPRDREKQVSPTVLRSTTTQVAYHHFVLQRVMSGTHQSHNSSTEYIFTIHVTDPILKAPAPNICSFPITSQAIVQRWWVVQISFRCRVVHQTWRCLHSRSLHVHTGRISLKINRILIWKQGFTSQEIYCAKCMPSCVLSLWFCVDETAVLVFIWRSCDVIIAGGGLVALAGGLQMKRLLYP